MKSLNSTHCLRHPAPTVCASAQAPGPPVWAVSSLREAFQASEELPSRIQRRQQASPTAAGPSPEAVLGPAVSLSPSVKQSVEALCREVGTVPVMVSEHGELLYRHQGADEWLGRALCQALRDPLRRAVETDAPCLALRIDSLTLQLRRLESRQGVAVLMEFALVPIDSRWHKLGLSPRQGEVAAAAVKGATVPQMAEALGISANTVKAHLKRVYEVAGVHSRIELARLG